MYKPYSIFTPNFEVTSGGIRVMYGLYGHLLAKGQIVFLNAIYDDIPYIAIYPEIAQGNPLKGTTVVRYILNKPGTMASMGIPGPTSFEPDDIIYVFSRLFMGVDENYYMFLPILNLHIFKDQKKKRNKKAVFYGKGQPPYELHPQGCITIDRELAQDQQNLADLLNQCEVLYCYDPVTAMLELARLCGVRIVLFPSTYSLDEFKKYEPGMNGINWSEDQGIKLDVEAFREHYISLIKEFDHKLDLFLDATQKN